MTRRSGIGMNLTAFALVIAACGGGDGKTEAPTTTLAPATTIAKSTTTVAVDRATVDAALDALLAATKAKREAGNASSVNAAVSRYHAASADEDKGARLTARPIPGVPAAIVTALHTAFSVSADRTEAYAICGEKNKSN